jgi:O-methyltransferase involved in polyketide biosynthesis
MVRSIDYDPARYGRGAGGSVTVLRAAIVDYWVRAFLAEHPAGTVAELGTGLNTRFERVDNGQVHWFDLDLQLPARYRFLLPLADPVLGRELCITLFRASSPGAAD